MTSECGMPSKIALIICGLSFEMYKSAWSIEYKLFFPSWSVRLVNANFNLGNSTESICGQPFAKCEGALTLSLTLDHARI